MQRQLKLLSGELTGLIGVLRFEDNLLPEESEEKKSNWSGLMGLLEYLLQLRYSQAR